MILPECGRGPGPHADMPGQVKKVYEEARKVASKSAGATAALLRKAAEMLCREVLWEEHGGGSKWPSLDKGIAKLKDAGVLSPKCVEGLTIVRLVGNDAVHEGVIDMEEDEQSLELLFDLINDIVQETISRPRERKAMSAKIEAVGKGRQDT